MNPTGAKMNSGGVKKFADVTMVCGWGKTDNIYLWHLNLWRKKRKLGESLKGSLAGE